MGSITIRQLLPADWQILRDIRLEALREHPEFFSPSRDETKFTEGDWVARLTGGNSANFGLFDDEEVIGLTGIFRPNHEAAEAQLVASYIRAAYRGRGYSKLFYEARLEWARKQPGINAVLVGHRDDNAASKAANQKFGFQFVGSEVETWPDGQVRPLLSYRLELVSE